MQPLQGLRVLDIATYIAAPYCATLLGEFGAEVIKIELPGSGEPMRKFGSKTDCGETLVWLSESRNKKCIYAVIVVIASSAILCKAVFGQRAERMYDIKSAKLYICNLVVDSAAYSQSAI